MKTDDTCVNCAILECHVRRDCEDNELPLDSQELEREDEDTKVTVHVVVPKLAESVVDEKRFW
jgi:hypothetical protein